MIPALRPPRLVFAISLFCYLVYTSVRGCLWFRVMP